MKKTIICELLNIKYPIIQGGMVWVSGAKLAAATSNSGCLGVIGAGSMKPDLLKLQILKAKSLTNNPLAVNIPVMYKDAKEQIDICLDQGINIFITSAGSPKKYTNYLKDKNCTVLHVTSTPEMAIKCEKAGVDAVIVEGFEAGGHNGREELTSLVLIPQCVKAVKIPVIAAGGFASGSSVLAGLILGASGIQMGTRFMMTKESSAHDNFKQKLVETGPTDTMLMMKRHIPVRLVKNKFFSEVQNLEQNCSTKEDLIEHLGHGRAKSGMHDGNLEDGELEAGQICSDISDLPSVQQLITNLLNEYTIAKKVFI